MPRPPRRVRNLRVEDELWEAAQAKCEADGLVLSEVLRELLSKWVKRRP